MTNSAAGDVMAIDPYDEADLYCAAFDYPISGEVDWLLGCLSRARTVLEPFCGNARYGPVFAARGLEYWGIDRSAAMIARATAGDRIHVIQGDARSFSIGNVRFDLGWCPINSIRHLLTDQEIINHLRCVRAHLGPSGVYVVETDLVRNDGPNLAESPTRGTWMIEQPSGMTIEAHWRAEAFDLTARRTHERATFRLMRGREIIKQISHCYLMRMLTFEDWRDLVREGGFSMGAVHRHCSSTHRPRVDCNADLENGPDNCYFFLEPQAPR